MRFLLLFAITAFYLTQTIFLAQVSSDVLVEQLDQRDMYSKTFLKNNMITMKEIAGGPIHYLEGDQWLPIDCTIVPSLNSLFSFENKTNVIKSSFPHQIDESSVLQYEINGVSFTSKALKNLVSYNGQGGVSILNETLLPNQAVLGSEGVTYQDLYQGVSDHYEVGNAVVKNKFVMHQLPSSYSSATGQYLGFEEQFNLPNGWEMSALETDGDNLTNGPIEIKNEQGEVVLQIPAPVFFDSGNEPTDGSTMIQGKFHISLVNGVWKLYTLVPAAWLQDQSRVFPVTLDPTVTINGTTGGWQSPNNWVDNNSFVFIGVCCGNLTHRAWIKFNTSGIPDNSCITNVQLRVYVGTVVASTSELTHVYDVTGAFGPYGGINPAAYTDFGNGYYTSFTINGVGNYGYYDLGANADALLQSQLLGNWFQVGLIFNNEPSTNYKIITGTSSSIVVEYNAPPCTVLPVGLTDYDVKCSDGNARLDWTTATEQQSAFFTVSKSLDGVNFEDVQQIPAAGNSQETNYYGWNDPIQNDRITYYRLSQTDFDGKTTTYPLLSMAPCSENIIEVFMDGMNQIHVVGKNIQNIQIRDEFGRSIRYSVLSTSESGSVLFAPVEPGIYHVNLVLADGTLFNTRVYID